jgi:hypothetical protein
MNYKHLAFALICFIIVAIISSCDLFSSILHKPQELSIEVNSNKTTYEYNETINVSLAVMSEPGRDISISWKINGEVPTFTISDQKALSFNLTPSVTTTYTIEATVSDGVDEIKKACSFTVKQFALVGTWKATNVLNPAYFLRKDVVGIWQTDRFELYYFDANGGTQARTYSARGIMEFPKEGSWIKLTEKEYFDQNTSTWKPWTYTDGFMWVNYSSSEDKQSVTVQLDMTSPGNTAEYTWEFIKVDDTIDSWF